MSLSLVILGGRGGNDDDVVDVNRKEQDTGTILRLSTHHSQGRRCNLQRL
jgi:hypothetical protein